MKKSLYDYCMEHNNKELLLQWHPTKNELITPKSVSYGSKQKPWWRCKKGHEWQASLYTRTSAGAGCPVCAGKVVIPGETDFASKNPEVAAEWHPTKNRGLKPNEVPPNTSRKVWWICEKGHEWQARVCTRSGGSGCPVCSHRIILPGENDLATTHPSLVTQWHPAKNGTLTPKDVIAGSTRRVWWQCSKGHEWCAGIASRALVGSGCPVCAGKIIIPGENDMATMFPKIAKEWHPTRNEALTAQQVSPFSNRKAWWKCPLGHEYRDTITHRTYRNNGCPYCSGSRVLPGFNDLATLEPVIASQWHPTLNGGLKPEDVTLGSNKKVYWKCADGHVWCAAIYARTRARGSGCPVCMGTVKVKKAVDLPKRRTAVRTTDKRLNA